MKKLNTIWIWTSVAVLLILGGAAAMAQTEEWQPKTSLLPKLQKPHTYDGFSLRIPQGMVVQKLTHNDPNGSMTVYIWNRKPAKGVLKGMALTLFEQAIPKSPEQAASDWIDQTVSRNISDITQSDVQSGTIDGIDFARIYYKGPLHKSGKMVHGFVYVGITEGRTYIFESVDYEPANTTSLPIYETAVLTLHETQ